MRQLFLARATPAASLSRLAWRLAVHWAIAHHADRFIKRVHGEGHWHDPYTLHQSAHDQR